MLSAGCGMAVARSGALRIYPVSGARIPVLFSPEKGLPETVSAGAENYMCM